MLSTTNQKVRAHLKQIVKNYDLGITSQQFEQFDNGIESLTLDLNDTIYDILICHMKLNEAQAENFLNEWPEQSLVAINEPSEDDSPMKTELISEADFETNQDANVNTDTIMPQTDEVILKPNQELTELNNDDDFYAWMEETPTLKDNFKTILASINSHTDNDRLMELYKEAQEKNNEEYIHLVQDKVVEINKALVKKIAVKYLKYIAWTSLTLDDIINIGLVGTKGDGGILKALKGFDSSLGNTFSTYATWWIHQAITRAICDEGDLVRLPVHMHEKLNKYRKVRNQVLVECDSEDIYKYGYFEDNLLTDE